MTTGAPKMAVTVLMLSSVGENTVRASKSQTWQNTAPPKKQAGIMTRGLVALHEDAPGSAELLSDVDCVTFLQDNRTQFTYEELVQRRADREARALHRRYQSNNGAAPDWQKLGTFLQASNRAVLWDIPNKLTLAGDLSGLSPEEKERLYWRLARYEHRRWNAFHFSRGWVTLPLEELTREEREQCRTKHAQERRHACLVDWDDLDALPQNKPGLLKFYDYENVVQLLERQQ